MSVLDWLLLGAIVVAAIVASVNCHRRAKRGCGGDCAACGGCASKEETR